MCTIEISEPPCVNCQALRTFVSDELPSHLLVRFPADIVPDGVFVGCTTTRKLPSRYRSMTCPRVSFLPSRHDPRVSLRTSISKTVQRTVLTVSHTSMRNNTRMVSRRDCSRILGACTSSKFPSCYTFLPKTCRAKDPNRGPAGTKHTCAGHHLPCRKPTPKRRATWP